MLLAADFVGRQELVRYLASKLLRSPMEPFYITGQKRVGKTSLSLAAAEFAKEKAPAGELDYCYILWGRIMHEDPRVSLRELGETIDAFVASGLPKSINRPRASYDGSLAPLLKLADLALSIVPNRKFVIIIDEFDDIHQELFLQGNLAETFFSNLRAVATTKNISLILVGGENMPFVMNRQAQKLNRFSRVNLDYFSRDNEWEDYQLLVRRPTAGVINWHEDAIAELFNITNGNPYFTKLVCSRALIPFPGQSDLRI
jgi:hypothetical protein